jgi:hypothetical protein
MRTLLLRSIQVATVILLILIPFIFLLNGRLNALGFDLNNPIYDFIQSGEWWLKIVFYVIILGIILIVIFITLNISFTVTKRYQDHARRDHEILFAGYLVDYLFASGRRDQSISDLVSLMKKQTKSKIQALAFFNIYLRIVDNAAGDLRREFLDLMYTLDLWGRLEELLYSRDFSDRIMACRIISCLRITAYNDIIRKYKRSVNHALRTEAIAAAIVLSDTDNLSILKDYNYRLSLIDVNIVVNAVLKNQKREVDFGNLINSSDPQRQLIAALIIKSRNYAGIKNEIRALAGASHERLNLALWDAYLTLEEDREKRSDFIVNNFTAQSQKVRELILSHDIGSNEKWFEDFIIDTIQHDESLAVKTRAMYLLFNYKFEALSRFVNSEDPRITKAYKEVIDFNS